jgi:hypothetical protein
MIPYNPLVLLGIAAAFVSVGGLLQGVVKVMLIFIIVNIFLQQWNKTSGIKIGQATDSYGKEENSPGS